MSARPDSRFLEVDVLRGLAALTVVLSHYLPFWSRYVEPIPVLVPNAVGYWAVKLFFVISGFVIFFTLERCKTALDFAVLRFSRLYPAYWASLLIGAASTWLGGNAFWLGGFLVNATMVQQFVGFPHVDNVYWSLSVELAFYVNVAVLFALGLLRLLYWVAFVWLAASAIWVLGWHDAANVTAALSELVATDERTWPALLFALDYSPYFVLGIAFYRGKTQGWTRQWQLLCLIALGVEFALAGWEGLVVGLVCTGVFALAVNGRLGLLLGKTTLWLGSISYCLYLVHRNLGFFLLAWFRDHAIPAFLALGIAVVVSLLVASVLAFALERPASSAIRSWYKLSILRSVDSRA